MWNEFGTLLHSSLSCSGEALVISQLMIFAGDTLAHIGIAGILTSLVLFRGWPYWLFWLGLALICLKELLFDLPNGQWEALVVFDSAWDVLSWFVGFFAQWVAIAGAGRMRS